MKVLIIINVQINIVVVISVSCMVVRAISRGNELIKKVL